MTASPRTCLGGKNPEARRRGGREPSLSHKQTFVAGRVPRSAAGTSAVGKHEAPTDAGSRGLRSRAAHRCEMSLFCPAMFTWVSEPARQRGLATPPALETGLAPEGLASSALIDADDAAHGAVDVVDGILLRAEGPFQTPSSSAVNQKS
jgi:hypothetical protein